MGCAGSKEEQQQHDPWQLAATGQARHLQRWLELGGNPSALDRQGGRGTLLHAAAGHDQVECVRVRALCTQAQHCVMRGARGCTGSTQQWAAALCADLSMQMHTFKCLLARIHDSLH